VYSAAFLNVTAIFYNYASPVPADGRERAYIDILANDYIACYRSLRVNKRTGMDDRNKALERIKHKVRYGG